MSHNGHDDGGDHGLYHNSESGSPTMESDVQPLTEQSLSHPYKSPLDNYTTVSAPSPSSPMKSTFAMGVSLAAKFALSFPTTARRSNSPLSEKDQPVNDVPIRNTPSPAPTEILEPEPENILLNLQSLNIKVRDFAYPSTSQHHHPAPPPPPVTEIFDQNKAIAEYEFRLAQSPRIYPISGKTLRRLLDLGWVSMEEAKSKLHQMDWESMKEYDARDSKYPWRPVRWFPPPTSPSRSPAGSGRNTPRSDGGGNDTLHPVGVVGPPPDAKTRENLLLEYGAIFLHMDRVRRMMEVQMQREEDEKKLVEAAQERMRIMEAEREGGMGMVVGPEEEEDEEEEDGEGFVHVPVTASGTPCTGKKRSIDDTSPASSVIMRNNGRRSSSPSPPASRPVTGSPAAATANAQTSGSKRVRLSGNPLPPLPAVPSHQHQHLFQKQYNNAAIAAPQPPPKQYPAPLSSYDPAVYPEAEAMIRAGDAARRPLPLPPLPTCFSSGGANAATEGSFSAPAPKSSHAPVPGPSRLAPTPIHVPTTPPTTTPLVSLGRTDTPPLDEDEGYYDEDDESDCPSLQKKSKKGGNGGGGGGGGGAPGPSGLKRTLSRTQTFSQL